MRAAKKICSVGLDNEPMLKSPTSAPERQPEKLLLSPVPHKGSYLCRFTPELNGRAFLDIEDSEGNHATTTRSEVWLIWISSSCQALAQTLFELGANSTPVQHEHDRSRDHFYKCCPSLMICWQPVYPCATSSRTWVALDMGIGLN